MKCRHCGAALDLTFIDLGSAPPSNAYLTDEKLRMPETWYPLRVLVCEHCWLTQTEDHAGRETLFSEDYAYFSSYSESWLAHAKTYVETAVQRFNLTPHSHVIEVAANDGYLLQYVKNAGIPCTGIEPTASTAATARRKGIEIIQEFFGTSLAIELKHQGKQADLMVANNVLAHVPDINDFVRGFSILLKPSGVVTFEFPHLLELVRESQFDTIYHEHYSYLSLTAVDLILQRNGLMVFDVESLPTHGGSLRVYAQRSDTSPHHISSRLQRMREAERLAGVNQASFYTRFQEKAERIKNDLLRFLLQVKLQEKRIAAYGAAAKGNTLLNFAGVRPDLLPYVVDRNPAKQKKFLPGSRIPIVGEGKLLEDPPDYVLILPWNLKDEIITQLNQMRSSWKYVTAIPSLAII